MTPPDKLLLAFLVLFASPVEAHGPYNQNVLQARAWLRERTSDKAFHCADILWDRESHWAPRAGEVWRAYGIPQAFPGRKLASAGDDWRTNATTQVRWGARYVRNRYGTRTRPGFCRALRFQTERGWY